MERRRHRWFALTLLPLLSGCIGAVALPLLAGGTMMATGGGRVRAATPVAAAASTDKKRPAKRARPGKAADSVSAKAAPPAQPAAPVAADDPWQLFVAYALARQEPPAEPGGVTESAILRQPPEIDEPERLPCSKPVLAVIIDLDDGAGTFVPERLAPAPPGLAEGLARLRQAGIVVLWISRLPAARAPDVARALNTSGLDPIGFDQLLLLREAGDRKQLLRENANEDVCVVALAGDERGDFDELFDYLRDPGGAAGLYPMMGNGWFLTPSLAKPATPSTER
jgi:hypothetical protein